jgi:site-specific DNA recombinase
VPPFGVLIVSEQKSIGREMSETAYVIKQLAEAGVEIFEYVHGASLTPKNYMDKMMSTFRAGADEAHREQSSERVHEAHTRLHRAGHVVGGRVFGYRNQDVFHGVDRDGRPLRSHVERVINPAEAAVVRKIFMLYDQGHGLKLIAKLLTSEGALSPKHFRRTDGLAPVVGWAASTVRGVLTRETYRGQVVWNKTRKRNTWGKWAPSDRPESEWLRTTNESLRIIDELSGSVSPRAGRRSRGRPSGSPAAGSAAGHRSTPRSTCWPGSLRAVCAAAGSSSTQVASGMLGSRHTSATGTVRTDPARTRCGCRQLISTRPCSRPSKSTP